MNDAIVEELTNRLPTAELVKIIKGALEYGRRDLPFTESDLLRAMAFGIESTYVETPPVRRRMPVRAATSATAAVGATKRSA